jgi:xanthine dehydrogenase small subunit
MNSDCQFLLNGKPCRIAADEGDDSLLRWLNRRVHFGTKEGCGDGDCGACTVALQQTDAQGGDHWIAVNACLMPMGQMPGRAVRTVESLGTEADPHPAQSAMMQCHGSQCGYCTPGFVMSLAVAHREGRVDDHALEGNLCRCTGYQMIRRAAQTLADMPAQTESWAAFALPDAKGVPEARLGRWCAPRTVAEALREKQEQPDAQWICGATDLGLSLSRQQIQGAHFIALDRIEELHSLRIEADFVRIGAAMPLTRLEREVQGALPALDDLLPWFAARQIKNRATLGGNLGSASPIGDLLPLLLALDAEIELAGPDGRRQVAATQFFRDYRKTELRSDELIVAIHIPRHSGRVQAGYKVAKRQTDDISIVAAVFCVGIEDGRVEHARLAFGGVAATPKRAVQAESMLSGKTITPNLIDAVALHLQSGAFQPLSDHRASARYRSQLCASLWRKFMRERFS